MISATRMIKMFTTLRKESEDILKLKGLCPDNKIPKGLLLEGHESIKKALSLSEAFEKIKSIDRINESYPELKK